MPTPILEMFVRKQISHNGQNELLCTVKFHTLKIMAMALQVCSHAGKSSQMQSDSALLGKCLKGTEEMRTKISCLCLRLLKS